MVNYYLYKNHLSLRAKRGNLLRVKNNEFIPMRKKNEEEFDILKFIKEGKNESVE